MKILNHGHLILEDSMGDDLTIVNAARQSFNQRSDEMGEKEKGLINFLMRERHGTPFEMPTFRFNIKCPITVAREWQRHRIGSYNEVSGRYKKLDPEFYLPDLKDMRTQVGKPGNYSFESLPIEDAKRFQELLAVFYHDATTLYERLLDEGLAKEVARSILPVGIYTQFTWNVNLRALLNFISLRSHPTAMLEIRKYSNGIEEIIKEIVPVTWECFEKHERVCP